jgi:hypothetical protein
MSDREHKAFKHVFTSPSSVDLDKPKAACSSNARIHGMRSITKALIAYIATLVSLISLVIAICL